MPTESQLQFIHAENAIRKVQKKVLIDNCLRIQRWFRRQQRKKVTSRRLKAVASFKPNLLACYKGWRLRKKVLSSLNCQMIIADIKGLIVKEKTAA